MKASVISEENWTGVFFGVTVGLGIYWASGDFTRHAIRQGAVISGTIICAVLTLVLASLAYKRRGKERNEAAALAKEMEAARDANSVGST